MKHDYTEHVDERSGAILCLTDAQVAAWLVYDALFGWWQSVPVERAIQLSLKRMWELEANRPDHNVEIVW